MLVLLMLVASVTACSNNEEANAPAPSNGNEQAGQATNETPTPVSNVKKIIYSLGGEPETLDPTLNIYLKSSIVLQNMFRGLYKVGPDNTAIPALAEGYKLDETGTVYTFTLKDGIKWSDGSPVTAKDFEYSWKRVLNPDTASGSSWYMYYIKGAREYNNGEATVDEVGIRAIDEKTFEVTLVNPTPYFLDLTCVDVYYPVKEEVVENNENWTQNAETLISTGPFMAKEIKPKEKLVLVKNPNYIDDDKVKIDELEIVFIESPEAELAAYQNGDIDIADNVSLEALTQYVGTEDYFTSSRIGTHFYDFNCEKEPYNDVRVRRALALAIDREIIINNIIQGTYQPAYGLVPYGIPYAPQPGKEFRDVVGRQFEENVKEAQQLLAEAGFPNGEGFPTIHFITFNSQMYKDVAQALQGLWQQNLGITSEITTFESKVYWDQFDIGNFDVAFDNWTGDYPDPMTIMELFTLENTSDDCRWIGEGAERYDELMQGNMVLKDNVQRYKNFEEAEQILMDEMPIMPLYHYHDEFLVKPYVTGVMKNYIGHTIFEYADINK